MGSVALPPLDGPSGFHTALERGLSHQVEGQRLWLRGALGPTVGVVWAVNVQVVVEAHLDGQISCCQPGRKSDNDDHLTIPQRNTARGCRRTQRW